METSIDLYADGYAGDYDDNQDEDQIEEVNEGEQENEEHNQETDNIEEETNEEEKKIVKPKRVIKNPRPKLDVNALQSRKGLLCLEGYFKNKKYKGRGHEEEDLRNIMKTYEYWCHRLFPKFPFDECLAKIEKLGTKKNVQTYINRIRMDQVFDEDQPIRSDNEDEQERNMSTDQFDNLVSQQGNVSDVPTLTEEQADRIRLNKERANQLRQKKLQRAKERAEATLQQEACNEIIHIESEVSNNIENDIPENTELQEEVHETAYKEIFDDESRENITSAITNTNAAETECSVNSNTQQSCGSVQKCIANIEDQALVEEEV